MGVGEIFLRGRGVLSPIKFALREGQKGQREREREKQRDEKREKEMKHVHKLKIRRERRRLQKVVAKECLPPTPQICSRKYQPCLHPNIYSILSFYFSALTVLLIPIRSSNCMGVREKLKRIMLQLHAK